MYVHYKIFRISVYMMHMYDTRCIVDIGYRKLGKEVNRWMDGFGLGFDL